MEIFRIRASGSGNIMAKQKLGETGTSYLSTWQKERLYERRNKFSNKYTKKGITKEDDSIAYISKALGFKGIKKNEEQFEDEFMTGEPDVIYKDTVIDVKNSYDCFTFPLFVKEFITEELKTFKTVEDKIIKTYYNYDYYCQGQVYMHLTGKKKYKLIYTLMDTPEELIRKEFQFNNPEKIVYEEFKKDYLYEHLPDHLRIKVFEFDYDKETVDKLIGRVKESRDYIKNNYAI